MRMRFTLFSIKFQNVQVLMSSVACTPMGAVVLEIILRSILNALLIVTNTATLEEVKDLNMLVMDEIQIPANETPNKTDEKGNNPQEKKPEETSKVVKAAAAVGTVVGTIVFVILFSWLSGK